MRRRIVIAVGLVLFSLIGALVFVIVSLWDRSFPSAVSTRASVTINLEGSSRSDEDVFEGLATLARRDDVDIYKVATDLRGDDGSDVLVDLTGTKTARFVRFGGGEVEVLPADRLRGSYASGTYLLAGSASGEQAVLAWLDESSIRHDVVGIDIGTTLSIIVRDTGFLVLVVTDAILAVALALYWLTSLSRGRSLRTLGGVPQWRVQLEDIGGFALHVFLALGIVTAAAAAFIGITQGWTFVPLYLKVLLLCGGGVAIAATVALTAMSLFSRPSASTIARREPATRGLATTSAILKAVSFVILLSTVGPAVGAWNDARSSARQLKQWESLSDQVTLSFVAAIGESGFQRVMGRVHDVVAASERSGDAALSYTWTAGDGPGADLGRYDAISLVTKSWVGLMADERDTGANPQDATGHLKPLPNEAVPRPIVEFLISNFEIWTADRKAAIPAGVEFYAPAKEDSIPVAGGGGDLLFPSSELLVVVPSIAGTFDDDFVVSAASTRNIVLTGIDRTEGLLSDAGLASDVKVKWAAEEGILRARLAAYFAWIRGAAVVGLAVALAVAAGIAAFLSASLRARSDFARRLAGQSWLDVVSTRVASEWTAAAGLMLVVVVLFSGGSLSGPTIAAAAVALALVPVSHMAACRWAFSQVLHRRL